MKTVKLNSIDAYNKLYGLTTYHPLVTVVDLKKATSMANHIRMDYGVYALFLKNGVNCTLKYGRKEYDYQEGSVVSFAPGSVIDVEMIDNEITTDVVGLIFHPDLIFGTLLGEKINDYGFFKYSEREALHLSESERKLFEECLDKIRREVEHPVDNHSADLISANIHLLLEYLNRFYDRQFITRHKVNNEIVKDFERRLRDYFDSGESRNAVPYVAYFADKANLTPGYFSDLVKKETGTSPKTIIDNHLISVAKRRLINTNDDVAIIAYDLGFQYPQHFSRQFKRLTGKSPSDYRKSLAD